jgi:Transglutaminase-like superfamily
MTGAEVLARRERVSAVGKFGLSAEIVVAYARVQGLLRRRSLPAATAALRRPSSTHYRSTEDAYRIGLRLGRAVTRVLAVLPYDPRCLGRSLVLTALLARRGIPATLVIGVRPEPFAAHAWVEHDGRPLLQPATEPFERLLEV